MDAEMTAPSAAAAIATVIIEPVRRSNILLTSLALFFFPALAGRRLLLLQRIRLLISRRVVLGQRVGSFSLRKGAVFEARRLHHRGKAFVSFDAARLVINLVLLLALPGEFL